MLDRSEVITTLVAKCARIMGKLGPIAHDAKNIKQGYSYTSYDAISGALRQLLAEEGVAIFPSEEKCEVVRTITAQSGNQWAVQRLTQIYTVVESEKGEWVQLRFSGEGADPGDKALPKAQTMADKYMLKVLFRISTGGEEPEDAEADEDEPEGEQEVVEEQQETIGETQYAAIKELIAMSNADEKKFLAYFQIKEIADLPASDFDRAMRGLERTMEAKAKKGGKA